ncbi:pE199L [African swine fever virus]|uniref:PE199L n=1 Tax=African swine fever virus TaxID=10497 RepID=A0A894KTR6_ASF|nr:pE199L [African swine fever virus]
MQIVYVCKNTRWRGQLIVIVFTPTGRRHYTVYIYMYQNVYYMGYKRMFHHIIYKRIYIAVAVAILVYVRYIARASVFCNVLSYTVSGGTLLVGQNISLLRRFIRIFISITRSKRTFSPYGAGVHTGTILAIRILILCAQSLFIAYAPNIIVILRRLLFCTRAYNTGPGLGLLFLQLGNRRACTATVDPNIIAFRGNWHAR